MPAQEIPSIRVVLFNGKAPTGAPGRGLPRSLRDTEAASCVDICDSDAPPPCVCDSGPCSSERCIDICGCESDNSCPCEAVSVPPPCSCDNDAPSSALDIKPDGMTVQCRHRTTFKMTDSKAG